MVLVARTPDVGSVTFCIRQRYFRKSGERARVKKTFSPVVALISCCVFTTLTAVIFSTIASMMGRMFQ
jgi:hypothetical protein